MAFSLRKLRNITSKVLTTVGPKSQNYVANSFERVLVDVLSGPVQISLPSNPEEGDTISVVDISGNASTNNITVSPNGFEINGSVSNSVINTNYGHLDFIFLRETGWTNHTQWIIDRLDALENFADTLDIDSASDLLYAHENLGGF